MQAWSCNPTRKIKTDTDENTNLIYEKVSAYIANMDIIEYENTLRTSDPPWRITM